MDAEVLEFAEKQGHEAAKFSLATLELARARCHQLVMLLFGGAGALLGLAIGQYGANRTAAVLAGVVAVWWFLVAAWVLMRGLKSAPVRSWAQTGVTVLELERQWQGYAQEAAKEEGAAAVNVAHEVRQSALRNAAGAAEEYREASTLAARALDQALMACAATPLLIFIALVLLGLGRS